MQPIGCVQQGNKRTVCFLTNDLSSRSLSVRYEDHPRDLRILWSSLLVGGRIAARSSSADSVMSRMHGGRPRVHVACDVSLQRRPSDCHRRQHAADAQRQCVANFLKEYLRLTFNERSTVNYGAEP